MPLTQAYKQVKDGVVKVLALNNGNLIGSGTGSIIDSGKFVLTCAHCVIDGANMAIKDPAVAGGAIKANVLFIDKNNDIALLELPQAIGAPIKFANSAACAIGNGAFVVGYPMGVTDQVLLSSYVASITSTSMRIDTSVNHGNSGGPLFNLQGEQIGVINAKHGSLSKFLITVAAHKPAVGLLSVGGVDPIVTIQKLIEEMQINLNLGIGYAIPTSIIKPLHPILGRSIP